MCLQTLLKLENELPNGKKDIVYTVLNLHPTNHYISYKTKNGDFLTFSDKEENPFSG